MSAGLIERYRARLPLAEDARPISLGEGDTPLLRLGNLARTLGSEAEIYLKYEGLNPSGSFKDRGMTVAVSQAVHEGSEAVLCASTGNTSASAAAYAARAGIKAFVLIPDGRIARGKLAQAVIAGATVIQIEGNFDDGMRLVKSLSETLPVTLVNSVNPWRLQGQKTAAFEIVEALGRAPDYHCLPVGNAGNISAYWIGYSECAGQSTAACNHCQGRCPFPAGVAGVAGATEVARPKMVGYQASGAAPFLRGAMVDAPETVATAIRIGHPQSWDLAWAASRESGGWFAECSDEAILQAQRLLAEQEGIFCEPASAASLAGAMEDLRSGRIPAGSTVVCTLTGHGMKDPDTALSQTTVEPIRVAARMEPVQQALKARL